MLPFDRVIQHQYWARNYKRYANPIRDLLQAENMINLLLRIITNVVLRLLLSLKNGRSARH
jgi:hypothetical protein